LFRVVVVALQLADQVQGADLERLTCAAAELIEVGVVLAGKAKTKDPPSDCMSRNSPSPTAATQIWASPSTVSRQVISLSPRRRRLGRGQALRSPPAAR
jgi:hypothetical protein